MLTYGVVCSHAGESSLRHLGHCRGLKLKRNVCTAHTHAKMFTSKVHPQSHLKQNAHPRRYAHTNITYTLMKQHKSMHTYT